MYGNMAVVRYFCEERGVPVNFVPPDDETADGPDTERLTPLLAALHIGYEEVAVCLLSLPRAEDSPPLNLEGRSLGEDTMLALAAREGMVRVVEALLVLGVDLQARDADGHLAVCRAMECCHVEVVKVLLGAHATQGGAEGVKVALDVPARTAKKHIPSSSTRFSTIRTPHPTRDWPCRGA